MDNAILAGMIKELGDAYANENNLSTGKRLGTIMELVSGVVFNAANWNPALFHSSFNLCPVAGGHFAHMCDEGCKQ